MKFLPVNQYQYINLALVTDIEIGRDKETGEMTTGDKSVIVVYIGSKIFIARGAFAVAILATVGAVVHTT